MYVCVPVSECVPMSTRALQDQRGIGSPGFGVIGGCELPDWMPGTQLCSLQERYMLLTVDHRSSPLRVVFFFP